MTGERAERWDAARIEALTDKNMRVAYIREQLERVMPIYRIVVGSAEAESFDALLRDVAGAIAILQENERNPDPTFQGIVNIGALVVTRTPLGGWDLLVRAATVVEMHYNLSELLKEDA